MALRARLIVTAMLVAVGATACGLEVSAGEIDPPPAPKGQDHYDRALGFSVGAPQVIALTYERRVAGSLRFQAHAFTALVVTSLGARFLVSIDRAAIQPYVFAGLGLTHTAIGEYDNPAGGQGFGWMGGGLRFWMGRVLGFVELGGATSTPFGDEDGSMTGAVGLMWGWNG